jgi:hypothetical protein
MVTALTASSAASDLSGFRVRMTGSQHSQSVLRALAGAHERLQRSQCQQLFTDYRDEAGRTLQERLDSLHLTGPEFLRYVGFYEGYGQPRCAQARVMAFTQPGSLVVRVCPQIAWQTQDTVQVILIHEMLHSLGLGENPPTSFQITDQVKKRCGGRDERSTVRTATR